MCFFYLGTKFSKSVYKLMQIIIIIIIIISKYGFKSNTYICSPLGNVYNYKHKKLASS